MSHFMLILSLAFMPLSVATQISSFRPEVMDNLRQLCQRLTEKELSNNGLGHQELNDKQAVVHKSQMQDCLHQAAIFLEQHKGQELPRDIFIKSYQFFDGMKQRYPAIINGLSLYISEDSTWSLSLSNNLYLDKGSILFLEAGFCPECIEFKILNVVCDNCRMLVGLAATCGVSILSAVVAGTVWGLSSDFANAAKITCLTSSVMTGLSGAAFLLHLRYKEVLTVCVNPEVFKYAYFDFGNNARLNQAPKVKKVITGVFYEKFCYELTDEIVDDWARAYQLEERLIGGWSMCNLNN